MDDALNHLRRELVGRYEVEQELGHGGMAVVYLAKDLRHDRKVAIKVLRHDVGGASAERFLREIRTVAQLHHPHILQLLDSGTAGDHLFYVMPYVALTSMEWDANSAWLLSSTGAFKGTPIEYDCRFGWSVPWTRSQHGPTQSTSGKTTCLPLPVQSPTQ